MKRIVTFAISVTEMNLPIIFVILFCSALIEAKDFLQTGRASAINILDNSSEDDSSQVLALIIVEHNGNLDKEESHPYSKPRLTKKLKTLPLISSLKPHRFDTDSSGDSNSDEYQDSDAETNTDSESNYYHEVDYQKDISASLDLSDFIQDKSDLLRNRWRSCHKTAAKVCREACTAAYKNACDIQSCKSKFKKTMKKECKSMCKEFFIQS